MSDLFDTQLMRPVRKPVFADWRGRRRRVVIAAGVAAGVALAGWIVLIVAGFVLVIATGPASPGGG
jgi:hypothetical protein